MNEKQTQACSERVVRVGTTDLPVSCPPRDMSVWNAHPRVYLPVEEDGEARCPYCGALYVLEAAE